MVNGLWCDYMVAVASVALLSILRLVSNCLGNMYSNYLTRDRNPECSEAHISRSVAAL